MMTPAAKVKKEIEKLTKQTRFGPIVLILLTVGTILQGYVAANAEFHQGAFLVLFVAQSSIVMLGWTYWLILLSSLKLLRLVSTTISEQSGTTND